MSEENVELVRDLCDAFVAGDFERALNGLDDDIVWHGTVGGLDEGRVARGHKEVIESFAESLREWESHVLEARGYLDAGDRVVVLWHEEARGRSSGAGVTTDTAAIYTIRRGRVVEVQGYMDRAVALAAAGLADQDLASENAELVQRAIAAINARDLEDYLACCTDDVVLETPLNAVGGIYQGADGIGRFLTDLSDAAPDFRIELQRIEQVDRARVVVSVHTSSTGRVSGIELTAQTTNVYDFRDGRISRIRIYLDRSQALDDLELSHDWTAPGGKSS